MKDSVFIFLLLAAISHQALSQVGINTDEPNNRAVLDLNSPTHDQGLLVPRLSTRQRTATAFTTSLGESENGLLIFDTDDKLFYYWMFPSWKAMEAGSGNTIWRSGNSLPENSIGEEGDFYLNVLNGNVYRKHSASYDLALNIKGEKGLQGIKGDKGDTGSQGVQGFTGETGAVGPQGPVGPVGATGAPGPQGLNGIIGEKGEVGPQGPVGPVGATGLAGPQGLKGDSGVTGEIGPQGSAGPVGAVGPPGPQGLKGDTGETGAVGPQGLIGPAGATGSPGPQGPIGLTGLQGPMGPQGVPGVSTSFNARSVNNNYTASGTDDVIIALSGGVNITLPSAGSVPGKVYYIRHNLNLLDVLGPVTIRAPSGNVIIDGSSSQTITIGLLALTAITIIAVDTDKWYVIGKF
jgi:hypothetical protein